MSNKTKDFLAHYGVLGMKWGVRKDRTLGGLRARRKKMIAERKEARNFNRQNQQEWVRAYNAAADKMNSGVQKKINDKYKRVPGANVTGTDANKKYMKESVDTFNNIMTQNFRGQESELGNYTSKLEIRTFPDGDRGPAVVVREKSGKVVSHASDTNDILAVFKIILNKNGFIEGYQPVKDVKHSDTLDIFLSHYGVKGMKWGVRKDRRAKAKAARKKGGAAKKSGAGKRTYDARKLSNSELKRVVTRMELEKRYKDLNQPKKEKGGSFVKKQLKSFGKQHANKLIPAAAGAGVAVLLGTQHDKLDDLAGRVTSNIDWNLKR